jgi:hypothetical protein
MAAYATKSLKRKFTYEEIAAAKRLREQYEYL